MPGQASIFRLKPANFSPPLVAKQNQLNPVPVVYWFEATSAYCYTDTAGTTPVTSDNDLVAAIRDKYTNAIIAVQATSGNRPKWHPNGSNPYLEVDGSRWLQSSGTPILTDETGQHTTLAAVRFTNNTGTQNVIDADGGGVRLSQLLRNSTGTLQSIAFSSGVTPYTDGGGSITAGTDTVLSERTSISSVEAYINGTSSGGLTATTPPMQNLAAGVLTIGNYGGDLSQPMTGRIYGFAIYKGYLDDATHSASISTLQVLYTASLANINGTLANTLGVLTLSSTAALKITGTSTKMLGALALSSNAKLLINGTLAKTLGTTTLSSNSKLLIQGSLSKTLGATTLSSNSRLALNGTLNKTLGVLSLSSSSKLALNGTLTKTLGTLTLSSAANLLIKGTLSKTLGVSALISQGGVRITGSLNKTLGVLTGTETGVLLIKGSLTQSLRPLTSASSGRLSIQGTVNTTLSRLSGTETGILLIKGSLSKTLGSVSLSSSGYSSTNISGTLSITLEGLTCSITSMGVKPVTYRSGTRFSRSIMEQIRKSRQPIPRTTSGRIRQ